MGNLLAVALVGLMALAGWASLSGGDLVDPGCDRAFDESVALARQLSACVTVRCETALALAELAAPEVLQDRLVFDAAFVDMDVDTYNEGVAVDSVAAGSELQVRDTVVRVYGTVLTRPGQLHDRGFFTVFESHELDEGSDTWGVALTYDDRIHIAQGQQVSDHGMLHTARWLVNEDGCGPNPNYGVDDANVARSFPSRVTDVPVGAWAKLRTTLRVDTWGGGSRGDDSAGFCTGLTESQCTDKQERHEAYDESREYDDYYDDHADRGGCVGDCYDMDNDGRTSNDVDADRDGRYETP